MLVNTRVNEMVMKLQGMTREELKEYAIRYITTDGTITTNPLGYEIKAIRINKR